VEKALQSWLQPDDQFYSPRIIEKIPYNLAQAAVLAVKAGTDLLLGPRGLSDTQNMIFGLKQAVTSGQIAESQIDASVTRILELKLKYKIIPHDKALQLARVMGSVEQENGGSVGEVRGGHASSQM